MRNPELEDAINGRQERATAGERAVNWGKRGLSILVRQKFGGGGERGEVNENEGETERKQITVTDREP